MNNNLNIIKPNINSINQNDKCHIASGCQDMLLNTLKFFCYSSVDIYYINMPVIRPTNFMFEKYYYLGKEKWEIYAKGLYIDNSNNFII